MRALALDALRAYRDRGCTLPPPPSDDDHPRDDELHGRAGGARRVRADDARGDGARRRATRATSRGTTCRPRRARRFRVVVIGAGMSGLLAAIRLEEAGIPYVVLEKNESVGGTWFENTYPGCRVDVANHFYCYSFAPNHDWSEFFSQRDELQGLLRALRRATTACARRSASAPRWSRRASTRRRSAGRCGCATPTAREETLAGERHHQRRRPAQPAEDPGHPGPRHVRRPGVPLGAVAAPARSRGQAGRGDRHRRQRVPARARGREGGRAAPVVFQRSPQWMVPNPRYHATVSDGEEVAARARAVLRALVPLPAVLAGLGRPHAVAGGRPGVAAPGALGQRHERDDAGELHRTTWRSRSATIPSCSPRSCRTTRRSASACCRTTAAGSAR